MRNSFASRLSCINVDIDGILARGSAHFAPGNNMGSHYHDNLNMVFILEGGCVEKRAHSSFERVAADLSLLRPREPHETILVEWPTKYFTLDIEPEVLARYEINEQIISNAIQKSPDAKFLMLNIFREILFNDAYSTNSVHLLFLEFASVSAIQHRKTPPGWIKTIHELLQDKWNETVSLDDLSKAAGVNPITISKHFPAYFASTLGSYMRKLKVERSLSMIKNEDSSLTDIAYTCNFADQSHFIRCFRQFTGISPLQYRNL